MALSGCASQVAGAGASAPVPVQAITGITLEHRCFGCPTESVLVLRRDGSATYTLAGNERAGTTDTQTSGTIAARDFDALARLIVSQGFFELEDVYDDPEIRDGPWTSTRVSRGAQDKQVFRRDEAGPASLKSIEAAIDSLRARIRFGPQRP